MNSHNLESGYPEQHAYDDHRRESDRNAGNEHRRGEYRGGRYGRPDGMPQHDDHANRRDGYRSDEHRGFGEEQRSGGSLGGAQRSSRQLGQESGYGEQDGGGYPSGRNPSQGYSAGGYGSGGGYGSPGLGGRQSYPESQGYGQRGGYGQYRDSSEGVRGSPQSYRPLGDQRLSSGGYGGSEDYNQGSSYGGGSDMGLSGAGSRYGYGNQGYQDRNDQPQGRYEQSSSQRGTLGGLSQGYGQSGIGQREHGQSAGFGQFGTSGSQGNRSGRTPKGYTRSDERIREDVNDRLMQSSDLDPSEIEVNVNGGEVTLVGTVSSRHEKFLAEQLAESVSGVKDIANQLRLQRADSGSQSSPGSDSKRGGSSGSSGGSTSASGSTGSSSSSSTSSRGGSGSSR